MNIEKIDKWLDKEYGISYIELQKIHEFLCKYLKNNIKLKTMLLYR